MTYLQTISPTDSRIELKNEGGYVYLIIEPDKKNNWLFYKWRGFLLTDELQTGFNKIIEVLHKEKLTAAIADHSNIVGPWNEINHWLANDWSPRASKVGLQHLAICIAGDIFSNISLELFINENYMAEYATHVFDNMEDGKEWLKKRMIVHN